MCPAEAQPPQAGAAEASPEPEGAKPTTTRPSPPQSGAAAPNSEDSATGAGTTEASGALAGAEAKREASSSSSGASFYVSATAPEGTEPTSAGTAEPRPSPATTQTATTECEKRTTADGPGAAISAFVDVLQHDLNAAVQRVEAGRLLLERLRGSLLQQAAGAAAFAASLSSAADGLKPLATESKYVWLRADRPAAKHGNGASTGRKRTESSLSASRKPGICVPLLCSDRTCAAAVQSYSCLLLNSALQAKELCDALRTDVVAATLERTIENHAQVLKQVATP
ncbi:hypothetical protein, conserved [Eimeria brunetti]|uniref:Uncharacterized protein n=1 Tax=Eimeria brunetti TaxID=51314 RepID=U6LHI4_9EIME|nr:hypothetical protein, conserved [Eimeria brunetti]